MRRLIFGLSAAALLALSACASTPRSAPLSEQLALYQAHAGAPVSSFRLFGSLTRWTALGENHLAVWTRPSQAWLLEVAGPCMELEFAPAIRLTDSMSQVTARFDRVIPVDVSGTPRSMQVPCIIQTIRPLDVENLRKAQAAQAQSASGT